MKRPRLFGTSLLVFTLLTLAVPARLEAAEREREDLDLRVGERGLHERLGTSNLGPLRLRAAEIGGREIRAERARLQAARKAGMAPNALGPAWKSMGPDYQTVNGGSAGNGGIDSGLASQLAIHPTDGNTIWLATSGGGVWKTTDGGANWRPTMDDLGQLPIGAVAVAKTNPNRLYAGSANPDTSNAGTQNAAGIGLLVSDDAGGTWRVSPAGTQPGTNFFDIDVDPRNANIVLAASEKGLFRSVDGGSSWTQILPMQTVSVAWSPSDPNIVFAGTGPNYPERVEQYGKVWKSTDGGVSFVEKTEGLPGTSSTRGRPEIAVAPSNANRVYVLFAKHGGGQQLDMAKSSDSGETWVPLETLSKGANILNNQGDIMTCVAVDPTNPDVVYAGGLDAWKSTDAGATWKQLSRWQGVFGSLPYVHADQHHMVFSPDGGSLYIATDGGLFRTSDGGESFSSLNRGLVTLQFNTMCQSTTDPNLVLGGLMDNGTTLRVGGTAWQEVYGGDGYGCVIHKTNQNLVLASYYYLGIVKSTDGGNFFRRSTSGLFDSGNESAAPFATILKPHPANPDWVYTSARTKLWFSNDFATTWTSPSGDIPSGDSTQIYIREFSLLPTDGSRIVIAANVGRIYESTDGAKTFSRIAKLTVDTLSAARYDRTDARTIWVSTARPNAGTERVWVTKDGGATWSSVSKTGQANGLPDMPVLTIEQDPVSAQTWYAATYIGVYVTKDNGATWSRYGTGLPNVIVTALEPFPDGSRIRVATFGRGMWEIDTQEAPPDPAKQLLLSKGRVRVQVDWKSQYSNESGTASPIPQKDEFGYFYFSNSSNPEVFVKVLDFGSGSALCFVGGLSDFYYKVTFTVVATGQRLVFEKPSGSLIGFADGATLKFGSATTAAPVGLLALGADLAAGESTSPAEPDADPQEMKLSKGRVTVAVDWKSQYSGDSGRAFGIAQQDEFCFFYFSDRNNPEVFVKVLDFGDGNAVLFVGGLTDFEYTVTFTNARGETATFKKPASELIGYANGDALKF